MQLNSLDIIIIVGYLLTIVLLGVFLSKRASKNIDNYFLGGNKIPWYILGVSNASGMFDITGTIWLVMLLFVYGVKSVFIPWAWPVFNQIFLMVYLSAWLRRSNVMTGAEWIRTRFGNSRGAQLSHIIIVVFAIIGVIGFLAYGFKGSGKFFATFLPWDWSPDIYALVIMTVTAIYVIKGGMYSVVLTEIIQFVIMTIAGIALGIIAINQVSPETLNAVIPAGWKDIMFGWHLNLDWSETLSDLNTKISNDEYSLFGFFFMVIVFKGFLVSMAGPAPNYDMQRILATRSPVEAAKMSGMVSIVLFIPRYMMIAGLTVLALGFFIPHIQAMGSNFDFELILPIAIRDYVPTGLKGILIAGLVAAFMSTYAATVNAAPAYIVNDIYKKYMKPNADEKTYVRMSYIISFAVILVGCFFGFITKSVDQATLWIVNSLYGGYTAANFLKWYWWRFNGYGYFWGMVAGLSSLFIVPAIFPGLNSFQSFPIILILSVIGCFIGTLLTKPENEEVLKNFYITVKPWGFWKPIYEKVLVEHPEFKKNTAFKRDMFNVVVGIIWQVTLVVIPIYLVIREPSSMTIAIIICLIATIILKKNWWDKLNDSFGDEPVIDKVKVEEEKAVMVGENK
jgi:SSS family solute:Na+ symporter